MTQAAPHIPGPVIVTEQLVLRPPRAEDFGAYAEFAASERAAFVGGGNLDRGAAWRNFAAFTGQWALLGFGMFTVTERETGKPIGMTGPWYPADWPEREIGWLLWDPAQEGRGIASEMARAARAHVYSDLGWPTAVSYIHPDNTRSIALAERLGAVLDEAAAKPRPHALVYRHPAPSEVSA